jgi:hypothetical protein
MAITARVQNARSARRAALRAARQERCASATRSSAAVSPVLMEDHPQLEALHHQGRKDGDGHGATMVGTAVCPAAP